MRILITGGLGFIGSHLEKELVKRDHEVTIFDRSRINRDSYIRGDICDPYSVGQAFKKSNPERVIHLAAMVSRKESEETPYSAIQTNINGTLNTVLYCKKYNAPIIYSGSSEEYGTAFYKGTKVSEDTPFGEPTSIYSMTKRMSEEIIQYYCTFKGLHAITVRLFMLYGENERANDYRSALIRFMDAAVKRNQLNVHKNTIRQWCYIGDAVDIITKIVENDKFDKYQAYNIGNDEQINTEDLAKKIVKLTKSTSKINRIDVEETIIPVKLASFKKIEEVYGWKAKVSIDEGLKKVFMGYPV